MSSIL